MAHATELTITTGRTCHGGDPQSDEHILSRESRVSVTWRLGEDEQDVTLMASVLAEEAERTLGAVCLAAGGRHKESCPQGVMPHSNAGGSPAASGILSSGTAQAMLHNGQSPHNGNGRNGSDSNGPIPGPSGRATAAPTGSGSHRACRTRTASKGKESSVTAPRAVPPPQPGGDIGPQQITAPQRLAIRALCHRLEVEDLELTLLLDERFGKRDLGSLSKEEAGALLIALQRGEWEEKAQPAFAN